VKRALDERWLKVDPLVVSAPRTTARARSTKSSDDPLDRGITICGKETAVLLRCRTHTGTANDGLQLHGCGLKSPASCALVVVLLSLHPLSIVYSPYFWRRGAASLEARGRPLEPLEPRAIRPSYQLVRLAHRLVVL
jgi:hypothetical protein